MSKLNIYFAHLPLERTFVEFWEVSRNDSNKLLTYISKLGKKVIAIELKRAIHDSTVVECSHS